MLCAVPPVHVRFPDSALFWGFGYGRRRREPLLQAEGGEAPCLACLSFASGCSRLECGGGPPETELLPTVPSHLVAGEHDGMAWGMASRAAQLKQSMP